MAGNSVLTKRIGDAVRYDVTGGMLHHEPIKLYATRVDGDADREYINPEFIVMFLRPGSARETLDPLEWHLQVSDTEEGNEVSRVMGPDEIIVEVAEMTHREMVESGHWAVLSALKNHQFEGINNDFHMWSRLRAMIAHFDACRAHRDNVGEEAGPEEGAAVPQRRVRRRV